MDINLIISAASIGIGVIGLCIAFYQSRKVKRVSNVVKKWGSDLSSRLESAQNSINNLINQIDTFDAIQWPQSKGQIKQSVQEQSNNISQISKGMKLFISTVSDED